MQTRFLKASPPDRPVTRGFTLLELLVTLAVVAILVGVAVPSYRSVVQRNTIAAEVNNLVGDMNYARSEAVARGQSVFICGSNDRTNCGGAGAWKSGWLVYTGNDPSVPSPTPSSGLRLRVHRIGNAQFSMNTNAGPAVEFDANGFSPGSNRSFCAYSAASTHRTLLTVAVTGRVEAETGSNCS